MLLENNTSAKLGKLTKNMGFNNDKRRYMLYSLGKVIEDIYFLYRRV
jgi:hypothetical protein